MYLELRNINKIKDAKINIGGLTIIAGDNDTGKSTVGRILFSLIKAFNRQKADFEEDQRAVILSRTEQIFFYLRRFIQEQAHSQPFEILRRDFYPPQFTDDLKSIIDRNSSDKELREEELKSIIEERIDLLTAMDLREEVRNKAKGYLLNLRDSLVTEKNDVEYFFEVYRKIINSEFSSRLCSEGCDESLIALRKIDDSQSAEIKLKGDKHIQINRDMITFRPFIDATFIESPLYIQMKSLIDRTGTLFDLDESSKYAPKISLHIKDLIKKLELAKYTEAEDHLYASEIVKEIGGRFIFDQKTDEFRFSKKLGKESVTLPIVNVASGIKSFGILQLLLQAGEIDENKVLILDEPETHLHPKWQLKYAELIIFLIKKGITIVLTSHSPYFVQALNYYARRENIIEKLSFYLSELDGEEEMATIRDVSDDISVIFERLAAPLQEIM